MADSKISDLTDGNPAVATDITVVARAGGLTRRITLAQLTTLVAAAIINGGSNEISIAGLAGLATDDQNPTAHKTDHENGGTDEISVLGLSGLLADSQTPLAHKTSHQDGGSDEISVAGLSGLLADSQTPLTENVQDIVGAMASDTATIDFVYGDAAGTLEASVKSASVTEAMQVLADNTTQNVSTTKHGYVPKAPNDAAKYLDGTGAYSTPAGAAGVVVTISLSGDATANSTTTGVEITGLNKTTGTGRFHFRYAIRYTAGATTTGVKFGINHTGTVTGFMANMFYAGGIPPADQEQAAPAAYGVTATRTLSTTAPTLGPSTAVDTIDGDMMMLIEGMITVTADGDLELWHASEVAAISTVKAGSGLILTNLG